jgi:hypothetical protein
MLYRVSNEPEIVTSAAIAETELIATRAVDARRTLRILNLPKDYIAGIGNALKILNFTLTAISKLELH